MAVEGTLDLFQLPEILQLISQQRKTGILTVQGPNDIVAISFLTGRIVAADALNQTMEEGLTRVLVNEGILSSQDLARATAEHPSVGGRLIDFLVDRRYVTRQRLLAALRLQTYSLIEQLLRWQEGDFKFYSGEEVSYEESFVPITVEELLLNAGAGAGRPAAAGTPGSASTGSAASTVSGPGERPAPRPAAPGSPPPLRAVPPLEPAPGTSRGPAPKAPPTPKAAPAPPAPIPRSAAPMPRPVAVPPPAPASAKPAAAPAPAASTAPPAFRRMRVEQVAVPLSHRRVARALAFLPVVLLIAVLLVEPGLLFLPFPWEEGQRQSLAQEQRSALYLKIDRAAKTFYLSEARFPERLAQLQQLGLLGGGDLYDSQGHALRYSSRPEGYTVQPVDRRGKPIAGAETTEAVTGNFLLDNEFITVSPDTQAPLVLLD
jgi:uncharacterized protein DUF4388